MFRRVWRSLSGRDARVWCIHSVNDIKRRRSSYCCWQSWCRRRQAPFVASSYVIVYVIACTPQRCVQLIRYCTQMWYFGVRLVEVCVTVLRTSTGADPGGSLGSHEPPLETKNFLEANSCRKGAEFGEMNRLEWHENGGWGSRDRFRGVEFKTDIHV